MPFPQEQDLQEPWSPCLGLLEPFMEPTVAMLSLSHTLALLLRTQTQAKRLLGIARAGMNQSFLRAAHDS